ncbi:MAG: DMT family transporter [Candidatus Limnocylindrales bacterium]
MSVPLTVRAGVALAFVSAALSGVAIYLNGTIVHDFPDQTLLAAVRNGAVGAVLLAVLLLQGRGAELRPASSRHRLGFVILGVIGGGIAFALFFTGLAQATATDAAIIQKTMFVWVAMMAVPLLGERLGGAQIVGMVLLLGGTLLIAPAGTLAMGPGELLILAATLLWAVEVIVARRLLGTQGALPAVTARMAVGGVVLFGIVALNGHLAQLGAWAPQQWAEVAITGAILLGYVATWYAALRRAPASTVTSVLVVAAVITALLQSLAAGSLPALTRVEGLGLVTLGAALVAGATVWWVARQPRSVPAEAAVEASPS